LWEIFIWNLSQRFKRIPMGDILIRNAPTIVLKQLQLQQIFAAKW
jgi:hypothetical protein